MLECIIYFSVLIHLKRTFPRSSIISPRRICESEWCWTMESVPLFSGIWTNCSCSGSIFAIYRVWYCLTNVCIFFRLLLIQVCCIVIYTVHNQFKHVAVHLLYLCTSVDSIIWKYEEAYLIVCWWSMYKEFYYHHQEAYSILHVYLCQTVHH